MAEWTAAFVNDLPDSAFGCVDPGGEKDDQGKTVPRSLRHYQHHNAQGGLDLPHLRNALSRVAQEDTTSCGVQHLRDHAKEEGVGDSAKMAVKFAEGSDDIIEGLAIPFGRKDLDGEDFGPDTDLQLDWFPDGGRPILYHHGFDPAVKTAIVGRETETSLRDDGLWVKAQLDKAGKYYDRIKQLVQKGAVGWSSGTIERLYEATKSGHITRWPVVEYSLTPTPAMPNRVGYAVKAADLLTHLTAVEAEVPSAIKTILDSEGGSESEPFSVHAERVTASLDAFVDRVVSRAEARTKSGRVLSAANRQEIAEVVAAIDQLQERRARLAELIARSDPEAGEAAKSLAAEFLRFQAIEARHNGVEVAIPT